MLRMDFIPALCIVGVLLSSTQSNLSLEGLPIEDYPRYFHCFKTKKDRISRPSHEAGDDLADKCT